MREAQNGSEAVEKALESVPDLIVMDLGLPLLVDGWAATRLLKSDERTRHVPIVVVTGFTQQRHEHTAHAAGCDAFLPKPCLAELVVEIGRLLNPTTTRSRVRPRPKLHSRRRPKHL